MMGPLRKFDGLFKLDMHFEYQDDKGNRTLQWCCGTIVSVVHDMSNKNSSKHIAVKVKSNQEFVGLVI